MKVIAIDPGNVQSAYAILDASAKIESFGILPNDELLPMLKDGLVNDDLYIGSAEYTLAIEMVASFGMAVGKEVFETVFWTGRFCQAWRGQFDRVYRMQVKMHLCHNSRAKDPNIRQALIDKLGPAGTKKAPGPTYGVSKDVWSALAVGVTWLETRVDAAERPA